MTLTLDKRLEVYKLLVVGLLASVLIYIVYSLSSGNYISYNTYVNPINPADTGYVPGYKNVIDHAFTK